MNYIRNAMLLGEYAIGALKWLLGIFMVLEGIETMISPVQPLGTGALGYIYSHRWALVVFGIIFILCGLTLLVGKALKHKKLIGLGLMAIYLCFLFAAFLQFAAQPGSLVSWLPNLIVSIVIGLLWLRWKFKINYINPRHFRKQALKLQGHR